jgi:hypothetical protein
MECAPSGGATLCGAVPSWTPDASFAKTRKARFALPPSRFASQLSALSFPTYPARGNTRRASSNSN